MSEHIPVASLGYMRAAAKELARAGRPADARIMSEAADEIAGLRSCSAITLPTRRRAASDDAATIRIDVVHLIGTLDRCISEMIVMADNIDGYDEPDRQTLKHHAEDAILAGKAVLEKLGFDPKESTL